MMEVAIIFYIIGFVLILTIMSRYGVENKTSYDVMAKVTVIIAWPVVLAIFFSHEIWKTIRGRRDVR